CVNALIYLVQSEATANITIVQEVGDVCNEIEICIEGTICDNDGLCSCPDPYEQTFNVDTKKCVSKVGEACYLHSDCTKYASCMPRWNSSLGKFSGRCQCVGKYFDLPFERTCEKRSKLGEPCVDHINDINYQPCDISQNLKCINNICQCENESAYVYDVHRKACAIKAGHSCYSNRHNPSICVHGAKCKHYHNLTDSKMKSHKTNSGSLRCRCESGYIRNHEGLCQPGFGVSCDEIHPCFSNEKSSSHLVCSSGRCSCPSPLTQFFENESGNCLNKVNSPCVINHTYCVKHAKCVLREGMVTLTCQCTEGFSSTMEGQCKLNHRMNCHPKLNSTNVECNNDAGLTCQDGQCVCFDSSLSFDASKHNCVSRLGGFCGLHTDSKSGVKFSVGCSGDAGTKCIKNFVGGGSGFPCFCSQDVKVLYPPKQHCDFLI
ncbi:unnamed protein product, partial [Allacma fusca]